MDSLTEIRAAINDLDRQQKKLINKIKYAEQVATDMTKRAALLRREVDEVQDKLLALIAREREAVEKGNE